MSMQLYNERMAKKATPIDPAMLDTRGQIQRAVQKRWLESLGSESPDEE